MILNMYSMNMQVNMYSYLLFTLNCISERQYAKSRHCLSVVANLNLAQILSIMESICFSFCNKFKICLEIF